MTTTDQARAMAKTIITKLHATTGQGPSILDTQDMYAVARALLGLTAELERAGESLGKIKSDLAGALQAHENTKADLARAHADAAALRVALLNHAYAQGNDGNGWYVACLLCGEDCRLPHRHEIVHSVACPLSTTSGAELLAELARLRANQRTAGTAEVCSQCGATIIEECMPIRLTPTGARD